MPDFTGIQIPTTQVLVGQAFASRLRAEFSTYDPATISWTEFPRGDISHNVGRYIQVHPGAGAFHSAETEGAGVESCVEDAMIAVSIFQRSALDQSGKLDRAMFGPTVAGTVESILELKRRVLKALSGRMLRDGSNNQLLTRCLIPVNATEPQTDDKQMSFLTITFATSFEWDLT